MVLALSSIFDFMSDVCAALIQFRRYYIMSPTQTISSISYFKSYITTTQIKLQYCMLCSQKDNWFYSLSPCKFT